MNEEIKIYSKTKMNGHSISVELRNSTDDTTGYIGVRKSWDYDKREMKPGEIIFNMAFNYGSQLVGHTTNEATSIENLINRAVLVCDLLDYYIKNITDFKKEINVRPIAEGRSIMIDIKTKGGDASQ